MKITLPAYIAIGANAPAKQLWSGSAWVSLRRRSGEALAKVGGALRALSRSLEKGSAIVEAQFGHPPAKLAIGGVVVWVICVAYLLGDMAVARDIAGFLFPGAR